MKYIHSLDVVLLFIIKAKPTHIFNMSMSHEIATVQIIMKIPSFQLTCMSSFPLMREDIPKFALVKVYQQWSLLSLECHYCEKKCHTPL